MTTMLKRAAALVAGTAMVVGMAAPVLAAEAGDIIDVNIDILSTIAIDCTEPVNMADITGIGQSTPAGTENDTVCNVVTNNSAGYTLDASTDRDLTNVNGDQIVGDELALVTPTAWVTSGTTSEWGVQVKSATLAGVDSGVFVAGGYGGMYTGEWLNFGAAYAYTDLVVSSTESTADGSPLDTVVDPGDVITLSFGAEVGASKWQPTGHYNAQVTVRATTN